MKKLYLTYYMKAKLVFFLKSNYSLLPLFIISVVLCITNYTPNTFLTGWDTLHPEFNFGIYWSRILLSGVWQAHQGLGAVAAQAHASEIPHVVILMFLSFFLKLDQVRYAYAFLMLILGPIGVYLFLKERVLSKMYPMAANVGAFAGGLLYLLNLGTLQQFYVPLEMFLTHFAFLGFVFLFADRYFNEGKRKDFLWFSILTLLIASQAHTSTLFYAYFFAFVLYFGVIVLVDTASTRCFTSIKRFLLLTVFTLLLNAFWLLPNAYFVVNHGAEIQESKINQMFDEEAFLQNKAFGDISDIAILKNFLFNWGGYVGMGMFGDLMPQWENHIQGNVVLVGDVFFALVLVGTVVSLIKRERAGFGTSLILLVSIFFLFNVNPPLGSLFVWFQDHIPLFKEAFRFPFTKFDILLVFAYAIFFGYFWGFLSNLLHSLLRRIRVILPLYIVFYILITASVVYFMFPAFQGYFISPTMRVNIPDRYFKMFRYFDSQSQYGRVAELPIHSFWGWIYYNWNPAGQTGYQGAGFLWFGIKQPLMDREFDRWNLLNEQYYREMSVAVYSQNVQELENVLEKFKIRWLLVDESVMSPEADSKVLFYPEIEKLLSSSPDIKLDKDFGNGLYVYKYTPKRDFSLTELDTNLVSSSDSIYKEYDDVKYVEDGNYVDTGDKVYPFSGITNADESLTARVVSSTDSEVTFKSALGGPLTLSASDSKIQFVVSASIKDATHINLNLQPYDAAILGTPISVILSVGAISSDTPLLLQLQNQSISFRLSDLAATYKPIGNVFLDLNDETEITLNRGTLLSSNSLVSTGTLESCGNYGDNSSFSYEVIPSGIKLTATDVNACITSNLRGLFTEVAKATNYEVFLNKEDHNARSEVCILSEATGLCINNVVSPEDNGYLFSLDPADLSKYDFRLIVDGNISTEPVSTDFTNIAFYAYAPIQSLTISSLSGAVKLTGITNTSFVVKKDTNIGGSVSELIGDPRICNTGSRDFGNSSVTNSGDFLRYSATDESLCDSYQFPNLPHNLGYVLEIRARNIDGVPLRVCLTNEYSKRCDLYMSLSDASDFTTQYFLVPPLDAGSGYTVNLSSLVFGGTSSINDLAYVSLVQVPYDFLKHLHVSGSNSETFKQVLVYNQAYEKGWVAFCGLLPCPYKHVMVNNWANGWIVNATQNISAIKILFVPQALEWLGLLILPILFYLARKLPQ